MLASAPQPVNRAIQKTFFGGCELLKASDTIGAKKEESSDERRKESGCHRRCAHRGHAADAAGDRATLARCNERRRGLAARDEFSSRLRTPAKRRASAQ